MNRAITGKSKLLLPLLMIAFLAVFIFLPGISQAQGVQDAINGLNQSASRGFDGQENSETPPESIYTDITQALGGLVGALLAFIGVFFLLLIIYGGFTWMNARGNEAQAQKAKETIEAAAIGLVIVLAAYAITRFVGSAVFQ